MARFVFQSKVDGGGGIDAVGLLTVIDAVEVHFHDVVFCIETVDLRDQYDLFEFSYYGGLVAYNQILDQLLGDGAATFYDMTTTEIVDGGTEYAQDVDTLIGPEVLVFGGNGGIDRDGRYLVKCY